MDFVESVARHYRDETTSFYQHLWHDEQFHFGLFEPDERFAGGRVKDFVGVPVERATAELLDQLAVRPGGRLVDAGCGIGGMAFEAARRFDCRVTGLNVTERQIELANERCGRHGLTDRVEFLWADCASHMPLEDGSCDGVINVESACHYPDRQQFLKECRRVIAPGGRLVAIDWMQADGLSAEDVARYVDPICKEWCCPSLESPAGYQEKIEAAMLRLVLWRDFGERAMENARIMRLLARQLSVALFFDWDETRASLLRRFDCLSKAWLEGAFRLALYVAERK